MKLIVQDWWNDNGMGTRRLKTNLFALYFIKTHFAPYIATGSTIHCVVYRECLHETLKPFSAKHIVTRSPCKVKKEICKRVNTTYSYPRSFLKFKTLLSSWTWLSQSKFSEMHPHSTGLVTHPVFSVTEKCISFMFCWPRILIHPCNENQLDALFILSLFRQSTSLHRCSEMHGQ
jgi:hypothetical protein